jgi:hypothetical protein
VSSEEGQEDVMAKDREVDKDDRGDNDSHEQNVLIDAQKENAERSKSIFRGKEVDIPIAKEKIHKGVYLQGSPFHVIDCKVGIEYGEQDNDEKSEKELVAIAVDIYRGFSIRFPANEGTSTGSHIPTDGFRHSLATILSVSFVFLELDHFSPSKSPSKNGSTDSIDFGKYHCIKIQRSVDRNSELG